MRDHGGLIVREPSAVYAPSSVDELASCVRTLRAHRTPWVTRGAGHSSGGQSLIHGGAVVEMAKLTAIVADDGPTVTVQAGIRWRDVMAQLVRTGRRPTVVTGELTTTVGGTLSVGGVGETSHFEGLQIDGVRGLTIVTPDGEIHHVGIEHELARFVLAGHGQLGVIAEATLATRPRVSTIAARALAFESLADYLALVDGVIARGDGGLYPFVRGRLLWRDGVPHTRVKATVGAFSAELDAAPPADLGGARKASDPVLFDLLAPADREAPAFAPCAELVLPRAHAIAIWSQLTDDVRRSGLAAQLPDGASVVVVAGGTLPLSPAGDGAVVIALRPKLSDEVTARRVAAALRELCARALSLGAKLYPIGEEPDDERWARRQYADAWPQWSALKDRLDPDRLCHPWRL
jgi:cytokinin dehydrogenase